MDDAASNINFNPVVKFENDGASIEQFMYNTDNGFYSQDVFIVMLPETSMTSASSKNTIFAGISSGNAGDMTGIGFGNYSSEFTNETLSYNQDVPGGGSYNGEAELNSSYANAGIINIRNNAVSSPTGQEILYNSNLLTTSSVNDIAFDNVGYTDINPPYTIFGTEYWIGKNFDSAGSLNGRVAEIFTFAERVPDADRQKIESYLAIKYGFTLSSVSYSTDIVEGDYILADQSTKVWDFTANSSYHNDVAGIGRDDVLDFIQKQSKSVGVSSDAIITIGLGAIASSNTANANSFSSNKDFLMWGNNNGVINTTTDTELICAPEKTIGRTWKTVENGSVGTVQVAANKAIIDGALTTPNTIKVLKVADDEGFTTNVSYVPLTDTTINSEAVYAVDFDFNGTKYFTYSEINGIFWNGDANAWSGGNSVTVTNGPSTNLADRDKVMVIDSETSLTHATLAEDVEVECVWIKENSKLMVQNNKYLEFDEDFILDGQLRLIGNGQLIQTHTGLSNVQGSGKLFRDQTSTVGNKYRYNYWSSPVRELNKDSFRVGEVMFDGNQATSETSAIRPITWLSNNLYDGIEGTVSPDVPISIARNEILPKLIKSNLI